MFFSNGIIGLAVRSIGNAGRKIAFKRYKSRLKRNLAIVIAISAAFVSTVRGIEMCFCDKDPDGCGEACHDCSHHTESHDDDCAHLKLDVSDIISISSALNIPLFTPCVMTPVFTAYTASGIGIRPAHRPQAPPDKLPDRYQFYSYRLFPRS
jgi:hypothetical protein